MNLTQFFERWPAKDARLFYFASGNDHDRLAAHQLVADSWRKKVDPLDFTRLRAPTLKQLHEAVRVAPLVSPKRVIVATEMVWPQEPEPGDLGVEAMARWLDKFPRDIVVIMSTPVDKPNTKNDLAQHIIRKGYWVVLTRIDDQQAQELLQRVSGWEDEELLAEVIEVIGNSPAAILSFMRVMRLRSAPPSPDEVREYLRGVQPSSVFELVDAVVMRDAEKAMSIFASSDLSVGQVIGAIDRKFTSLLQFSAELKKGRTAREAMQALRLPGFIVHGLYDASKRWRPADILNVWPTLAQYSAESNKNATAELLIARLVGL